jgi:small subunit ribosomal protein S9
MENLETNATSQSNPKKIKLNFKDSKYATGRRKRSIAKVWVKKGSGIIYVNGIKMDKYFKRPVHQIIVTRPLEISEVLTSYDVRCSVKGGGLSGQAGAIILGISKALITHDETLQKNLKKDKLTTRDSRVVERKKYGRRKARRSFQFSKR